MSIQRFFKSLTSTPTRRRPTRRSRQSSGFRPQLEALEDRCLLTYVAVPAVSAVVAVPDAYAVAENQTLSVPAPGVTANDTYVRETGGYIFITPCYDACMVPSPEVYYSPEIIKPSIITPYGVVTLHAGPAHGALDLNSDGFFTYTPSAGFWAV